MRWTVGRRRGPSRTPACRRSPCGTSCRRQGEVELGEVGFQRQGLEGQAGQAQRLGGRVLQDEHHLEERAAAQVARGLQGLHQLLEGQVLVLVGRERRAAHLGQQLAEGGARRPAGAQHQRVDEEADEALGLRLGAARDGRADADVVLPGVARQQHLEGRQQHHEGRGALPLRQGLEGLRRRSRGGARRHRGAPVRLHGADAGRSVGSSSAAGAPASCCSSSRAAPPAPRPGASRAATPRSPRTARAAAARAGGRPAAKAS